MLRLRVDHTDNSVFIASAPGLPTIKNRSGRSTYLCPKTDCVEAALSKRGARLRYALQGRALSGRIRKRVLVWPLDAGLIKQALAICDQSGKTCQNTH
jgi:hypothetical protein